MAGKADPLADCFDCGVKGSDRYQKEINNYFTVQEGSFIVWRNRCKSCHLKNVDKCRQNGKQKALKEITLSA
jgi:hypothetical protein